MQNKKLIFVFAGVTLLFGTAAFIGGRMLNNDVGPFSILGLGKNNALGTSINLIPAKQLPAVSPDLIGIFVARADNTVVVQSTSLKTGEKGIVVHKNEDGSVSPSPNMNYDSKIEVVITKETTIYRDTTQISKQPSGANKTVQQTVETVALDTLAPQSFVTVWGRKSGDRIIAEVILVE